MTCICIKITFTKITFTFPCEPQLLTEDKSWPLCPSYSSVSLRLSPLRVSSFWSHGHVFCIQQSCRGGGGLLNGYRQCDNIFIPFLLLNFWYACVRLLWIFVIVSPQGVVTRVEVEAPSWVSYTFLFTSLLRLSPFWAGRLWGLCQFEGRACDAMMNIYPKREETIYIYYWNCKYIGSSRLGSHLFECFGLQGFPLLTHDMQALTPVSAPPLTPLPCVLARASDTCGFKAINHWCVTTKFVNLQFCRLLPLPFQIVFPHVFPVHAKVVHAFFQDLHSSFLCLPAPLAPQEGTDHAATLKAWLFLSSSTIQAFLLIR